MTTWAILQARMTSNRLPGKVLNVVEGRSIMGWVVRAAAATPGIEGVCVAVPDGVAQEPLVRVADMLGVTLVRGSEHDVLGRFAKAARVLDATRIMRVTTDCPFSDPVKNGKVLELLSEPGVQYACNNEPFGFAHGLDCEVFTRDILERADREATDAYDREHVTPWIKRTPDIARRYLVGPGGEAAQWRLTVDYPEDLAFFNAVAAKLGDELWSFEKVVDILEKFPHLHDLNRNRRQR